MRNSLAIGHPGRRPGKGRPAAGAGIAQPTFRAPVAATAAAANEPAFEGDRLAGAPLVAWVAGENTRYARVDAWVSVAVLLYFATALAAVVSGS